MNINDLKSGFDQIKIKHFNSNTYRGTHAALVKGLKVYAASAVCHEKDQFNKRLGRTIAVGRAFHAWKEDAGVVPHRGDNPRTQVYEAKDAKDLDSYLTTTIFTEPKQTLEPVEPQLEGCCGGTCK